MLGHLRRCSRRRRLGGLPSALAGLLLVACLAVGWFFVLPLSGVKHWAVELGLRRGWLSPRPDLRWDGSEVQNAAAVRVISQLLLEAPQSGCRRTLKIPKGEFFPGFETKYWKDAQVSVCIDGLVPPCTVFSFGINNEWTFDDALVRHGCRVFSFDPGMGVGSHSRAAGHRFEPLGIGVQNGTFRAESEGARSTLYDPAQTPSFEQLSLGGFMERFNEGRRVDLVRMDVEGTEWRVLQQWLDRGWLPRQLLMEAHMKPWLGPPPQTSVKGAKRHAAALPSFAATLQALAGHYSVFNVVRNLWNRNQITGRTNDPKWVPSGGVCTEAQTSQFPVSCAPTTPSNGGGDAPNGHLLTAAWEIGYVEPSD